MDGTLGVSTEHTHQHAAREFRARLFAACGVVGDAVTGGICRAWCRRAVEIADLAVFSCGAVQCAMDAGT